MTEQISFKYYQIYAAPVDWRSGNKVGDPTATKISFAHKEDAEAFCEENRKIDKLYTYKEKSLTLNSSKPVEIENNSITYYQIYAAPVDWRKHMVGESKKTTTCYAHEEDAKAFCDTNIKIDKQYSYRPKTLSIMETYESKKGLQL